MRLLQEIAPILAIGTGATIVLDAWLLLLQRLGIPTLNFALLGRWVGHLFRGRFAHAAIARADSIPGELAIGWFTHYAIGIAFAAVLVGSQDAAWLRQPSLLPALATGASSRSIAQTSAYSSMASTSFAGSRRGFSGGY